MRRLADQVLAAYPRLDVLVNNVGGYWAHRHVTEDGLERTFAVNHLAPFLLTHLLLDRLRASAPARVVTVSSGAQAMGRIDFDDLKGEHGYNGQRAYSQSKLANVMFTYELARRLEGTGVTATVLHPGVVRTAFGAEDSGAWMRLMLPVVRPFMKSPEEGAAHVDPPGLRARGRRGHRPVLRQRPAEEVLEGVLRHRRRGPAVGRLRPPRRPEPAHGGLMRVGVHLVSFDVPGGPPAIGPTLARVGEAAERAGVANLSAMDHYLQIAGVGVGDADSPMLEGYTTLAYLAAHTSRSSSSSSSPG